MAFVSERRCAVCIVEVVFLITFTVDKFGLAMKESLVVSGIKLRSPIIEATKSYVHLG